MRAIHSVGRGFAGRVSVNITGRDIRQHALREFGRKADALGAISGGGGIAHTYEWGMEGNPAGRLWGVEPKLGGHGSDQTLSFYFINSRVPVPIDEREEEPQLRSEHVWKEKAFDQEYTRVFHIRAGGAAPTRTKVGPGGPPESLLVYTESGRQLWRKSWTNYSPYVGNFTTFFESFWQLEAEKSIEQSANHDLEREFKPYVEKEVNARARRGRYTPSPKAMTTAAPVVTTTKGKPMTAMNTSPRREVTQKTKGIMKRIFGRGR